MFRSSRVTISAAPIWQRPLADCSWQRCGGRLSGENVSLSADGGAAAALSLTNDSYGCGGGGGRIAIWYQAKDASVDGWTLSVKGGTCAYAGEGRPSQWGEDGTIYWRQLSNGFCIFVR